MMTSTNNQQLLKQETQRRRRFERSPLARTLPLLPRDELIVEATQTHGGTLTTEQISVQFWPPDIAAMLRYWGLSAAEIERLQQQYPAARIYEQLELLKFLKKVGRLKHGPRRISSEYKRLQEWLRQVYETRPEDWASLETLLDEVQNESADHWLRRTLEQNQPPPPILATRPVVPSERVSSACVKRLRLLYDAGWLDKDEPLTKPRYGRGQTLWYISKQARAYLAELRGVAVKDVPWKAAGAYGHLHTAHRLAINDFRIAVTITAERRGYTVKKWLDEADLSGIHSKQILNLLADPDDPDSKSIPRRLIPDSFFWLETGKDWFFFLEVDRATETLTYSDPARDLQFWSLKVRKYGAYFKQFYSNTYPEAEGRGRILVVTTSQSRLVNMARVCQKVAGKAAGRYWLTTCEAIKPQPAEPFTETIFTGKIWYRADQLEEAQALIW